MNERTPRVGHRLDACPQTWGVVRYVVCPLQPCVYIPVLLPFFQSLYRPPSPFGGSPGPTVCLAHVILHPDRFSVARPTLACSTAPPQCLASPLTTCMSPTAPRTRVCVIVTSAQRSASQASAAKQASKTSQAIAASAVDLLSRRRLKLQALRPSLLWSLRPQPPPQALPGLLLRLLCVLLLEQHLDLVQT